MKRYILSTVVVALAAMASFTSCSDFLDAENRSNQSADEYFYTDAGLEALRIAAYSELKALATSTSMYEWGTDLYIPIRGKEPDALQTYNLTPETSDVSSFYSNLYDLINHANCCIYYGENDAKLVAESKFLRAYGYYLLTQHFGSVPYIDHYINDATTDYPRASLDSVYAVVVEDLESIMNDGNLPANCINSYGHSGYVSQRAVKALLAKVCLAAGWDLETSLTSATGGTYSVNSTAYFAKARQYALEAIDGQSLSMSFEDKWSPFNEDNSEEIFSVQYDRDSYPGDVASGGHSLQNNYGGYYGEQGTTGMKQVGSEMSMSAKSMYLWYVGDERWDGTFMNTIYNYVNDKWESTGYYAYYNVKDHSNLNICSRYFPFYTTEDEAEAELAANQENWKIGDCTPNNSIQAYILGENCTKYTFNTSTGEVSSKETTTFESNNTMTYFPSPVRKFDDANTTMNETKSNDYRDIVLFHLSEMYLVAAEAYLMEGNTASALQYVNYVRNRSNAGQLSSLDGPTYQEDYVWYNVPSNFGSFTALDILLDEYAREMYAERTRWMDLRRTRQLVRYNVAYNTHVTTVADMSNNEGEVKWYRPIPATEIESNTSMTYADQNPGY